MVFTMVYNNIPRCLQTLSKPLLFSSKYKPTLACSFHSSSKQLLALPHPIKFTGVTSSRKMSSAADEVLFDEKDCKGIITLNNPKILNSLNHNMVRMITEKLREWQDSKKLIIQKGVGKAFCAGGDVVTITTGNNGNPDLTAFFKDEYILNNLIGTYNVPFISLITGVVMGGGCGLSIHGKYRVASEKSLFAMPETVIGLFPDVGSSHFLPKLKGGLGMFLGLTGYRLRGWDLARTGIATHFCPHDKVAELEAALLSLPSNAQPEHVSALLDTFHQPQSEFSLTPHLKDITECFTAPTLDELILRLKKKDNEFCRKQLDALESASPTSLVITFELLRRGASMTLQEALKMEFVLVCKTTGVRGDFFEGVRARLVDKDNAPKWNPATLAEVDQEETIRNYFSPLPREKELLLP